MSWAAWEAAPAASPRTRRHGGCRGQARARSDLQVGAAIPADLRLLAAAGVECDESVLTGESVPAEKAPAPVPAGTPLAELTSCALMGTVVRAGSGTGVVVATGGQAEFGR